MKLKELIKVLESELETVAVADRRARLSLAFTVKESKGGEVECDFVEASSLNRARAEELHRLEVILGAKREEKTPRPTHLAAATLSPPLAKRSDFGPMRPPPEGEPGDPDTPAIFRRMPPES